MNTRSDFSRQALIIVKLVRKYPLIGRALLELLFRIVHIQEPYVQARALQTFEEMLVILEPSMKTDPL